MLTIVCPTLLPIFYRYNAAFKFISMYFQSIWKTVWIQIRWLHQKPSDLDLQCFQKWTNLGSAGKWLKCTILINSSKFLYSYLSAFRLYYWDIQILICDQCKKDITTHFKGVQPRVDRLQSAYYFFVQCIISHTCTDGSVLASGQKRLESVGEV